MFRHSVKSRILIQWSERFLIKLQQYINENTINFSSVSEKYGKEPIICAASYFINQIKEKKTSSFKTFDDLITENIPLCINVMIYLQNKTTSINLNEKYSTDVQEWFDRLQPTKLASSFGYYFIDLENTRCWYNKKLINLLTKSYLELRKILKENEIEVPKVINALTLTYIEESSVSDVPEQTNETQSNDNNENSVFDNFSMEQPTNTKKSTDDIPKIINFIWVGKKTIKQEYLNHLMYFYLKTRKENYKIVLWTDRKVAVYQALNKLKTKPIDEVKLKKIKPSKSAVFWPTLAIEAIQNKFLKAVEIKEISELFSTGKKTQYKQELEMTDEMWNDFQQYMARECVGLDNIAAFVDILRCLVIFEGGIYIDADDHPPTFLYQLTVKQNFQNFEKLTFSLPEIPHGFASGKDEHEYNNNVMVSAPKHPLLLEIIQQMLKEYYKLDDSLGDRRQFKNPESKVEELAHYRSKMDLKRSFEGRNTSRFYPRMQFTLGTTGPDLIQKVKLSYAKKNNININELYLGKDFFSYTVITKCDGNWIPKNNDKRNFTDDEIKYGDQQIISFK